MMPDEQLRMAGPKKALKAITSLKEIMFVEDIKVDSRFQSTKEINIYVEQQA